DLALEIPRGIIKTPLEIATGRDPNQEHYLGRVNMYKTEGGTTEHHGFARRVLGVLDILDLLPDPVDRFYDPSQFPKTVVLDSPILPGQNIQGKDARAGDYDVHFGRQQIERTRRYEIEDLLNAKAQVFGYFEGGVRTAIIETRRGRNGSFETSKVIEARGRQAIDDALADPVVAAGAMDGREIRVAGEPEHIEVDRVEKRVTIRRGAGLDEDAAVAMKEYAGAFADRRRKDAAAAQGLRDGAARSQAAFDGSLARKNAAAGEAAKLWDELHQLAWRIGRQEAIDAEIARTRTEISQLQEQVRRQKEIIDAIEHHKPIPDDPDNPPAPTPAPAPAPAPHPVPHLPSTLWAWALASFGLAGILAAVWYWLKRRQLAALPPQQAQPA
ncbi:MAG: hypothetical protein NTX64_12820, partial [Elusimicrobia bacterium]|nr:hypothetical protein [Elusimicrobiota bacterium]